MLETLLQPARGDAPATVVSLNDAWLEAEISAPIVALGKRVGDAVASGETVVRLDCRRFDREQELAAAKVEVLTARENLAAQRLERARGLRRSKNIAEESFNEREAEFAGAQAETQTQQVALSIARDNVARCEIKAPFAGVVTARPAQLGEFAAPGKQLLRLLDTTTVELSAQLPVRNIASLQQADDATYRHNEQTYPVQVRAIVPSVETGTRAQEIRLTFNGPAPPPGASGRLHWQLDTGLLPAEYLVRRADGLGVLVARDGTAAFVPVAGAREGRPAPVDLPPHTQVITAGRYSVSHGDAIAVTTE
jgi:RND family efflux transporter MFP subunit